MKSPSLSERLRATFLAELDEQLAVMNSDLLALEARPDDSERLRSLFRVAHTLKGAARAVGISSIEEACHALETMLAPARGGAMKLGPAHFQLLFATADALAEAGEHMRAGENPTHRIFAGLGELLPHPGDDAPATPPRAIEPEAAPAAPEETAGQGDEPGPRAERFDEKQLKVDQRKLDSLLAAVEQLHIAIDGVTAVGREIASAREGVRDRSDGTPLRMASEIRRLAQAGGDLAGATHDLRLRPFADACAALPRVVRDLALEMGKDVQLEIRSGEVHADRAVVDGLREALLHLVRNAVDHGVEPPAQRIAAGKTPQARVTVAAAVEGGQVCVTVSDDGSGLDLPAVRASLARAGRPVADGDAAVIAAIFDSGVSTRERATAISGRGVGLDLVREAVERIHGTVEVEFQEGRGTAFRLRAPLTLITMRALTVRAGGQVVAIPTANVERVARVSPRDVRRAEGADVVLLRGDGGEPVRIVSLAGALGPPLSARPLDEKTAVVVVTAQSRRVAVTVDDFLHEDEIVLRPHGLPGAKTPHLSGVAILAGGKIALVINPQSVVAAALGAPSMALARAPDTDAAAAARILVVDDSITTRTLEQSVLAGAGYQVSTAVDGVAAWDALQAQPYDLVVSDVEMPRMDGFALCRAIRGSPRLKQLPVILVTALEREEDRALGLEAGADAYLGKSSFDQRTLLEAVQQLLK